MLHGLSCRKFPILGIGDTGHLGNWDVTLLSAEKVRSLTIMSKEYLPTTDNYFYVLEIEFSEFQYLNLDYIIEYENFYLRLAK